MAIGRNGKVDILIVALFIVEFVAGFLAGYSIGRKR